MTNQFFFSKADVRTTELARFNVMTASEFVGQVYKFVKNGRQVWQYEGSKFPGHTFRNRFDAANKLYERAKRPLVIQL